MYIYEVIKRATSTNVGCSFYLIIYLLQTTTNIRILWALGNYIYLTRKRLVGIWTHQKITLLNISQAHQKTIGASESKGYANNQCPATFNFKVNPNIEMGNFHPHKLFCTI